MANHWILFNELGKNKVSCIFDSCYYIQWVDWTLCYHLYLKPLWKDYLWVNIASLFKDGIIFKLRTTMSQDVQTRFPVQLALAKFLSKIKENFKCSASIMDTALIQKFPLILDRNLAKANCTENQVCTSCDIVVLGLNL